MLVGEKLEPSRGKCRFSLVMDSFHYLQILCGGEPCEVCKRDLPRGLGLAGSTCSEPARNMILLGMVACNTIHQSACQMSDLRDLVFGCVPLSTTVVAVCGSV